MKILQISTEFSLTRMGGAERMVKYLASHLSKSGHEVAILTCEASPEFDNVKIITIPKPMDLSSVYGQSTRSILSLFKITWISQLKDIFRHYDIIHLHNIHSHTLLFYSIIAAKKLKKKIVWTPHDYWFICPKQSLLLDDGSICDGRTCKPECAGETGSKRILTMRRRITKKLLSVDMVLPPSKYVADRVRDFGMAPEKIKVVYNGVEIKHFDATRSLGSNILFVGYMDKRKGTHTLLQAARYVKEKIPDVNFVFVGDGPEKENLAGLAKEWGIESNVSIKGHISESEFEKEYSSTKIAIVPSLWPEPFGLVAAEAMTRGIPVIASNAGALPEIVLNGRTGLLFESGNARELAEKIVALYANEKHLREFGALGNQVASENFDIRQYAQIVKKYYVLL